jgi:hypothetical protein
VAQKKLEKKRKEILAQGVEILQDENKEAEDEDLSDKVSDPEDRVPNPIAEQIQIKLANQSIPLDMTILKIIFNHSEGSFLDIREDCIDLLLFNF